MSLKQLNKFNKDFLPFCQVFAILIDFSKFRSSIALLHLERLLNIAKLGKKWNKASLKLASLKTHFFCSTSKTKNPGLSYPIHY